MTRIASFVSALAVCVAALGGVAGADEIWINRISYGEVTVLRADDETVTFTIDGREVSRDHADVSRIKRVGLETFNQAELMFSWGKYAEALEKYAVARDNCLRTRDLIIIRARQKFVQARCRDAAESAGESADEPEPGADAQADETPHADDGKAAENPDDAQDDDAGDECGICGGSGSLQCPECKGAGRADCPDCRKGLVRCSQCRGSGGLKCRSCNGSGHTTNHAGNRTECYLCKGTGKLPCSRCGRSDHPGRVACRTCGGSGKLGDCKKCDGAGKLPCPRCKSDDESAGEDANVQQADDERLTDDQRLLLAMNKGSEDDDGTSGEADSPSHVGEPTRDEPCDPLSCPRSLLEAIRDGIDHPDTTRAWRDMTSLQRRQAVRKYDRARRELARGDDAFKGCEVSWRLSLADARVSDGADTIRVTCTTPRGYRVTADVPDSQKDTLTAMRRGDEVVLRGQIGDYRFETREHKPGVLFQQEGDTFGVMLTDARIATGDADS